MPQYNDYHAMNLGLLQSSLLRKLWINPSEDDNGWPADTAFLKYSESRINRKLNQYYADLVASAKCLHSWFILPFTANYSQYQVPIGIFDIDRVFMFTSSTCYEELKVHEESYIEEVLSPGWRSVSGIPAYAYVGDRSGMTVKLGFAPAPNTAATAITITSGGTTETRPLGGTDSVYGVAGVDSAATSYVDSQGQDFGYLTPSQPIMNITTNTIGTITSISTTNSDNDTLVCSITWSPGDEMRVFAGELIGTVSIGSLDASYILNPIIGAFPSSGITMAANNVLVRGFSLPVKLSSKYQYPELNPIFHEAIVLGAAADLGKEEPVDTQEYKQALAYEQQYNIIIAKLSMFTGQQYQTPAKIISRR